jgi:hypothetical protein
MTLKRERERERERERGRGGRGVKDGGHGLFKVNSQENLRSENH